MAELAAKKRALAGYERAVLDRASRLVHDRLAAAAAAGAVADELPDPAWVADAMAAALPAAHPYDHLAGPFYDVSGLVRWLGITRQAIHHRVHQRQLLGCPTADGHLVFPTCQFRPDGSTIPHLRELLTLLAAGSSDAWTQALWLTAPAPGLDERTAAEYLASGGEPAPVLAAAHADAARWAA